MLRGLPGVWVGAEISTTALAASLVEALRTLKPGQRFAHPFVEPFRMERAIRGYEDLIDATIADSVLVLDHVLVKERML